MKRTSAAELVAMEQYVPVMGGSCKMTEHFLKGPFNPLEMKIYGKVQSLLGKAIRVEEDSVNAVLLDDQPGDAHERVLVAASVGLFTLNYIFILRASLFVFFSTGGNQSDGKPSNYSRHHFNAKYSRSPGSAHSYFCPAGRIPF